jgi:hypothetical protein
MKLSEHKIKFLASTSPDVVDYKFYYAEVPTPVDYDSPSVSLGNNVDVDGFVNADIANLLKDEGLDSTFNVGVAAIDDVGNESAMSKAEDYPLDFLAPDQPGPIVTL